MRTIAVRREASLEPAYFEALYKARRDPWGFETSSYEAAKYARTLVALPGSPRALLEVGCSIGVLTAKLAAVSEQVLALDVSPTAIAVAAERCGQLPNVVFAEMRVPDQLPTGQFDAVLLSEVVYYWDSVDIAHVAEWLPRSLRLRGYILLVHWTGPTDYPKSGDEAVNELLSHLLSQISVVRAEREAEYRLDLWQLN